MTRRALLVFVMVLACISSAGQASPAPGDPEIFSVPGFAVAPRTERGFKNADPTYSRVSFVERVRSVILGGQWLVAPRQDPLAAVAPDVQALRANGHDATVTWIGHSTLLVQLDGATFLTDPVWANRTGPFSGLVGVGRVTPPPIALDDLPPVDFVLISHDHYDHLDEPTVRRLAQRFNPTFVVPLGIKTWLAQRGIPKAIELDWGQAVRLKGLTIVCTQAQHGSGRSLIDQGQRLWSSWAVLGSQRFYFAGDTGYYSHFKEIGEALGPFDLAALPIGSYTPAVIARPVHLSPEEALRASTDLGAKRFIGIHWGTFRLAREPYDEPPARIAAEVERRGLDRHSVWIPTPGQTLPW